MTSGKPYALRLVTDKELAALSSQALVYATVEVVDRKGNLVADASIPVKFSVSDGGEVIATGSGNPKDPSGYFHTERLTDEGKALGVVKLTGKRPKNGKNIVNVTVSSPGIKSATRAVEIK